MNENETCLDVYVITVLKLLISMDKCQYDIDNDARLEANIATLTTVLKQKVDILNENMKICTTLQDNINCMAVSLNNLHHNNKELYDSILQISGLDKDIIANTHTAKFEKKTKREKSITNLQCSQCSMTFKRKCDLTQHLKSSH